MARDPVFERGHAITDEEIRRSRGYRREALKNAQELQRLGFVRMKDLRPVHYMIRSAALDVWPEEDVTTGFTNYQPRGYYGKPELRREEWIRCASGADPWQIMKVAEINYKSRPMYRPSWEIKLALEMNVAEMEVFLMMHSMGGGDA